MQEFLVFEENNDHEGETWYFYIPYNEELEEILITFCESVDEEAGYSVWVEAFDPKTIRKLPDNTTYMGTHNLLREFDLEKVKDVFNNNENDQIADVLYKGGIADFQKDIEV